MKKFYLSLLLCGFLFQISFSQNYVPFPTESSHWNCLFWHQTEPEISDLTNYQYTQQGDTILKGKTYKKIYYSDENFPGQEIYIGGLREDLSKQIYFFPYATFLPTPSGHTFPNDTSEQLLYTFNNLSIGMTLPINTEKTTIEVLGMDSVLIGDNYRKRYEIQNNLLFPTEYWIEGIGSTYDLLSPFTFQFEWQFYTLCYGDISTYYINSPNNEDSCHYSINTGITENELNKIRFYPNPATDALKIETALKNGLTNVSIYNIQGQLIQRKDFNTAEAELDIRQLKAGVYFLSIVEADERIMAKFIKK